MPSTRVMLFTDTLGDVNGVSRFIRDVADEALLQGKELEVVTSTRFEVPKQPNILNFEPLWAGKMPKYQNLEFVLPPLVRMLRHVGARKPDVIHISTPGPVGCVGRLAAHLMRIPLVGVYHTDFPAYIDHLFDDPALTWACTRFMRAFYKPFRTVFTRSNEYARSVEALGVPVRALTALRPGIRTDRFSPRFKDDFVWQQPHATDRAHTTIRVLSVGRVSIEKNLPMLAKVWKAADQRLRALGANVEFIVVGDGPYRMEMERELRGTRTRFLGFRYGEELSRLYATSDLFVFPSVTDTLGQVVMEAQASGVPVLVSDIGGPREVVKDGQTGRVFSSKDHEAWVSAIVTLATDGDRRRAMGAAAVAYMQDFSIERSFEHFWRVHEAART